MNPTAERALAVYGGRSLWSNVKCIEAEVSAHGWAFTLKRRPVFRHAHISMEIGLPAVRMTCISRNPEIIGVLDGQDVRLETADGTVIAERKHARRYLPGGLGRLLHWDDLDMTYFATYAFWNYFTLPALLMRDDIAWREIEPGWLEATFPISIPTHSTVQRFRFDHETGRLIQHDYTAEVITRLATAANRVLEHNQGQEVLFPSHRVVTPRAPSGSALSGPVLIDMAIHDFHIR